MSGLCIDIVVRKLVSLLLGLEGVNYHLSDTDSLLNQAARGGP